MSDRLRPADSAMHMRCTATMERLPEIMAFTDKACEAANACESACYAVRLAIEEVIVNIVTYGYAGLDPGPIDVRLSWDSTRMRVEISDEAKAFSPDDVPTPDLESGWDDRPIGGLGWHLVRNMVDELEHHYDAQEGNHYTLVKHFA